MVNKHTMRSKNLPYFSFALKEKCLTLQNKRYKLFNRMQNFFIQRNKPILAHLEDPNKMPYELLMRISEVIFPNSS